MSAIVGPGTQRSPEEDIDSVHRARQVHSECYKWMDLGKSQGAKGQGAENAQHRGICMHGALLVSYNNNFRKVSF